MDDEERKETEHLFATFLAMLEKDKEDEFVGFLFKFVESQLIDVMELGKKGFAPVINVTVFAKQAGAVDRDGKSPVELIIRPSRTTNKEVYESLSLNVFSAKLKVAMDEYGKEVWGMTPVDEREDLRQHNTDIVAQWSGAIEKG